MSYPPHRPRSLIVAGYREVKRAWHREQYLPLPPQPVRCRDWVEAPHFDAPRAPFPMCFTPQAKERLLETVGSRFPETGAKGFGPKDRLGFDVVEYDHQGSCSSGGAVYRPDPVWGLRRVQHHMDQPDEQVRLWTGDIHSHPGGMGQPSGFAGRGLGDLGYVQEVFRQNDWMECFFIPILTGTGTGLAELHAWVVLRGEEDRPRIAPVVVCDASGFPERPFNPCWAQVPVPEGVGDLAGVGDGPQAAPCDDAEDPQEAPAAEPALADTCPADDFPPDDPPDVPGAPDADAAAPAAPEPAPEADPEPPPAPQEEPRRELGGLTPGEFRRRYVARLAGLVSPNFHDKTVAVIGVGAGSHAVEKLARLCPARLVLCDPDVVEYANLSRTAYTVGDARQGRTKVGALRARLRQVNPLVEVRTYPLKLQAMKPAQVDLMLEGVDLIVAGTDSFDAQAHVNELAVRHRIPAVFIGIHARADSGRIVWTVPGQTGCYRCVAADRYREALAPAEGDAPLDLHGVPGLITDTQMIDMVALKILVAILERGCDSAMGRCYEAMRGFNEVVVQCSPFGGWGLDLRDALLSDLPSHPKDYAAELKPYMPFDFVVRMPGRWDPRCPICGSRAFPG